MAKVKKMALGGVGQIAAQQAAASAAALNNASRLANTKQVRPEVPIPPPPPPRQRPMPGFNNATKPFDFGQIGMKNPNLPVLSPALGSVRGAPNIVGGGVKPTQPPVAIVKTPQPPIGRRPTMEEMNPGPGMGGRKPPFIPGEDGRGLPPPPLTQPPPMMPPPQRGSMPPPIEGMGMKKGGAVRASKMGSVKQSKPSMGSASKRGDGIAQRGKTKGRFV